MRSSFLEDSIYLRYALMSYVPVFIEIILLFAAAFVTHFYLQRWKQVITNKETVQRKSEYQQKVLKFKKTSPFSQNLFIESRFLK